MFWNGLGERRHVVGPTVGLWGERFQHDLVARAHLVDRSTPWPQMLWRGAAPTIFVASPYDYRFSVVGSTRRAAATTSLDLEPLHGDEPLAAVMASWSERWRDGAPGY
jgi:hypothetical protein